MRPSKDQIMAWLKQSQPIENLIEAVRQSSSAPKLLEVLREAVPDIHTIAPTTYTLYRQFEHTGERDGYQPVYFARRSQLTRVVFEVVMGDHSAGMRDALHDLLWSICEETTWLLPAHEEQGPSVWDINLEDVRDEPFGAHTMLTREPDSIDLFAAETGAQLAETLYLVGDFIAPEVRQRVRQEVERRIFKPYLAYARQHWWFKGALNWNGVCNGSIGLAFLRLESDPQTLADALALVIEGFEAYIATGFEPDGGSIEGVGYWNYGLMYYVIVAELLRELSGGAFDLLVQPRLRDVALYPVGMALSPGLFMNFGDATEEMIVAAGITQRLVERTGVEKLRTLLFTNEKLNEYAVTTAKLPVVLRHAAWWDGTPGDPLPHEDFLLPESRIAKLTGHTATGKPVTLAVTAGHNDGHHSHTDIASFILHIDGESVIPDAGRGLYNKPYFRAERYQNIFNNSYSHNVPRFVAPGDDPSKGLQAAGPEFGGHQQYYGTIVDSSMASGLKNGLKTIVTDFHTAYDLPALTLARRTLTLNPSTGEVTLEDQFAFDGDILPIEEAFVTWLPVEVNGNVARIAGESTTVEVTALEPDGLRFTTETLDSHTNANRRPGRLTRLAVALPVGATQFRMTVRVVDG